MRKLTERDRRRIRRLLRRVVTEFSKPFNNSDWQIQWVRERLAAEAELLAQLLEEAIDCQA